MIAFLKGILVDIHPAYIILDVQNVGYKVWIPASLFGRLPMIGETIILHTAFIIRENSQALYGFLTSEERNLFDILVEQVTGVGPKLALSLIGHLPVEAFRQAVAKEDIAAISRVPGVGKKTAERLIIEMRDKMKGGYTPSDLAGRLSHDPRTQAAQDILGALLNLGYTQVKAQKAVEKTLEKIDNPHDLAALIAEALKHV